MTRHHLAPGAAIVACLACICMVTLSHGQGSLTPPGPPGPTMKTLQQVEPRTPIASLPFTITTPGSYYVTSNLASSGQGIVVETDDVSIDLMGFALVGNRAVGAYGLYVKGAAAVPLKRISLRNGKISNFSSGVVISQSNYCRMDNLIVTGNANYGIYLHGQNGECRGNIVSDCTISANGAEGIFAWGNPSRKCDGNAILRCLIEGNGTHGIHLSYADNTRVEENHVSNHVGGSNSGIRSASGEKNIIVRNTCIGNTINLSLSTLDTYGPPILGSGQLATTGAEAHPWANFSR